MHLHSRLHMRMRMRMQMHSCRPPVVVPEFSFRPPMTPALSIGVGGMKMSGMTTRGIQPPTGADRRRFGVPVVPKRRLGMRLAKRRFAPVGESIRFRLCRPASGRRSCLIFPIPNSFRRVGLPSGAWRDAFPSGAWERQSKHLAGVDRSGRGFNPRPAQRSASFRKPCRPPSRRGASSFALVLFA